MTKAEIISVAEENGWSASAPFHRDDLVLRKPGLRVFVYFADAGVESIVATRGIQDEVTLTEAALVDHLKEAR